jgi:hypothetical protein
VTDLAPWQRQGSAQSGSAITKRVTHPLNGAGTTGELAAFTNFTHRWPILLTPTTSRWRLRIRNRDSVGGAAQTGALSFLGAGVQTPTFSGTGGWDEQHRADTALQHRRHRRGVAMVGGGSHGRISNHRDRHRRYSA